MLVYLAHPVGPDGPQRAENLRNARQWFVWLIEHTDWTIVCPWMIYVENLDEERYRERGIRDDLAVLERCDAMVLCGHMISTGMRSECDRAAQLGLAIVNLTTTTPVSHRHNRRASLHNAMNDAVYGCGRHATVVAWNALQARMARDPLEDQT